MFSFKLCICFPLPFLVTYRARKRTSEACVTILVAGKQVDGGPARPAAGRLGGGDVGRAQHPRGAAQDVGGRAGMCIPVQGEPTNLL